jgi:CBS domain-containing protein
MDIVVLEGTRESEFEVPNDDRFLLRHAIFEEPLSSVPRRPTVSVPVTRSVADVIRAMNDNHVGCALVTRLGKLAGIFTERDVLRKVAGSGLDLGTTAVEQVMTPNPDSLPPTASIAYALRKMSEEGYRHVPLVSSDGSPVGVVAVRDIVAWMVQLFPEGVHNLPPVPGYPTEVDGG